MRPSLSPRSRTPLAGALLIVAFTAAACGTSDAPQDAGTAPTPAVQAAAATTTSPAPSADDAAAEQQPSEAAAEPTRTAKATRPADAADESIAANTDASAPAGTVDSAPGVGDAKVPIVTTDQDPVTIRVATGDLVAFRAVSGTDELVRVQGQRRGYPVSAGVSRIIRFTAKERPGKYAITFDETGKLVGTLVVTG